MDKNELKAIADRLLRDNPRSKEYPHLTWREYKSIRENEVLLGDMNSLAAGDLRKI